MNQNDLIDLIISLSPVPGLTADDVLGCEELLSGGMIDSMGLMEVVAALEKSVGKPIAPSDITIDNFNSVAAITRLSTKLAA